MVLALFIVAASCMGSQACNVMILLVYIYLSTYLPTSLSLLTYLYESTCIYHVILDAGWTGLHPFHVALSHQCKLHGLDVNASTASTTQQDRKGQMRTLRNAVNSLQRSGCRDHCDHSLTSWKAISCGFENTNTSNT